MPQAIVDPEELRRFALNLKKFNNEFRERASGLGAQLLGLNRSWRDQENKKFVEAFEEHMRVVARFIEVTDQYVPFLMRKAEVVEQYLQQR